MLMRRSVLGSVLLLVALLSAWEAACSTQLGFLAEPLDSLFDNEGAVTELATYDVSRISQTSGMCTWVIVFYDPTCGHCQQYAPVFAEVARSLASSTPHPLFAAINCVDQEALCREQGITSWPTVQLVHPHQKAVTLTSTKPSESELKTEIKEEMNKRSVPDSPQCAALGEYLSTANLARGRGHGAEQPFTEDRDFHRRDVANAFFFTMWHEVALVRPTQANRLVLLNFLHLVNRTLSGIGADQLLESLQQVRSPDSDRWKRMVLHADIPIRGTINSLQWKTCEGSSFKYRGFSCGLWLMYHSILASLPISEKSVGLVMIQAYVRTFFLCTECRANFAKFTYSPKEVDGHKAVLWLWKVHNDVNERLSHESGQDPQVKKRQFPDEAECVPCHRGGKFDEKAVYQFLVDRYRWKPLPPGRLPNLYRRPGEHIPVGWEASEIVVGAIILVAFVLIASWYSLRDKVPVKQRDSYRTAHHNLMKEAKLL